MCSRGLLGRQIPLVLPGQRLAGAPFQTIPGRPTPAGVHTMTYAQKLKDPRWKSRRLQILKAANYKCAHCHTSERLEVHHINYRKGKEPWDYHDCELMCLCRKCHELVEDVAIPDLRCLVAVLPAWTLFHMCIAIERTVIAMSDKGKSLSVASIFEEAAFRQRMEDTVRHVLDLQSSGNRSDYLAMAEEIMEGQR